MNHNDNATSQRTTQRQPITPEMMASLRFARDPALSPDGKRVAFTLAEWAPGQQRRRTRVWVVSGEEGRRDEASVIVATPNSDRDAGWSPDCSWPRWLTGSLDRR